MGIYISITPLGDVGSYIGVGRCLDGGSNTLCNKMELYVLNTLQVVSFGYFQSGEIELIQVRHVPQMEGTTKRS